jgi:hypothetical protein
MFSAVLMLPFDSEKEDLEQKLHFNYNYIFFLLKNYKAHFYNNFIDSTIYHDALK